MVAEHGGFRVGSRALDDAARAEYLALFDEATGLPRRALLYDRLLMSLARTLRTGTSVGVFFLRAGSIVDEEVDKAAHLVSGTLRIDDTVSRTGPTELVIVCHLRDAQEALVVARRIAQALRGHQALREMTLGYDSGGGSDDPGELLIRAATAPRQSLDEASGRVPSRVTAPRPERFRTTR